MSNKFSLPLLEESINSPAVVRHCVNILKLIISKVNQYQINVIKAYHPVYTLGKQIHWEYTEECRDVFWMMGPLHIEMAFMNAVENWLEYLAGLKSLKREVTSH